MKTDYHDGAEALKRRWPLDVYLNSIGITLVGSGEERTTNRCAVTEHKKGHQCVTVNSKKGVWRCHDCEEGGDVITWMATAAGKSPSDILREFASDGKLPRYSPPPKSPTAEPREPQSKVPPKLAAFYPYHDALGREVYQAVRMEPKSFRQRHRGADGMWVWNMDGVERVLYRLPEVQRASVVAIAEGEKDVGTLLSLGYCGTCNVGGAGKWLDGYTESLAGKDVIIFGDNDDAGRKHVELVFESIAGKVRQVKIVKIPEPYKDITEYVDSLNSLEEAKALIERLVTDAYPFIRGVQVRLSTMLEAEPKYRRYAKSVNERSFNLGKWLPTFGLNVRPLVPGELMLIIADTGVGKTAVLQNIAVAAAPLPTVMFELELPEELLFERFICTRQGMTGQQVEDAYRKGDEVGPDALNHCFPNLVMCDQANMTLEKMDKTIELAELKLGQKPLLVLVDYAQLLKAPGKSKYEVATNVAEGLKVIAKERRVVIIVSSQRNRPPKNDKGEKAPVQVSLHDAKDSGALENSSGLVLGVWRDPEDKGLMHTKVLKNTKGTGGLMIPCNFDGARMQITERAKPSSYEHSDD